MTKEEQLIEKNNELKKARLSTLNIIEDLSREIREHKLAEEKLKANEQKFKTVADFTYDWEYWEGKNNEKDSDTNFTASNSLLHQRTR